jgi:hypothetical protein
LECKWPEFSKTTAGNAIGIVVKILFILMALSFGENKKIATDSPTRAAAKALARDCPNKI